MPALVVVFASPMIAELLTSSAPPGVFFIPWVLALFVGFYGIGALLVREAAVRWNAGWPTILLLGCAFGVLEEGVAAKSFFDPAWRALGPLRDHGRALGVNWIWVLAITLFHATYSVALPILLSRVVVPTQREGPWISNRGFVFLATVFVADLAIFHLNGNDYPVPGFLTAASFVVAALFVMMARLVWAWRPAVEGGRSRSSAWLFALGAVAGGAWLLGCFAVPLAVPPLATAAWFAALAAAVFVLLVHCTSGVAFGPRGAFALTAGALAPYLLLGPYQEVNPSRTDSGSGMALVSAVAVVLLIWIAIRLRRDRQAPARR